MFAISYFRNSHFLRNELREKAIPLMKTAIFYPIYRGKIALLLHEVDRLAIEPTIYEARLKRHLNIQTPYKKQSYKK